MNAKISVFLICVEEIMYLLLCNLYDCTFNNNVRESPIIFMLELSICHIQG